MKRQPTSPMFRNLKFQPLQSRAMLAGDFQSPYQPLDVNVDLEVNVQDVVGVFSALREHPDGTIGRSLAVESAGFPDVTGDNLLTALDALRVINQINSEAPLVTSRLIQDSGFSGNTNRDLITNDIGLEIQSNSGARISVRINDEVLQGIETFQSGNRTSLPSSVLDSLLASPLADGRHQVTILAEGESSIVEFSVDLDRTPPNALENQQSPRIRPDGKQLVLEFDEVLASEVSSIDPADIVIEGLSNPGFRASIDSLALSNDSALTLGLAQSLQNGTYEIILPTIICDPAGNPIEPAAVGVSLQNRLTFSVDPVTQFVTVATNEPTISVIWDNIVQEAVVSTSPGPTIASRAYAMMHTAMFDAWSAYDLPAKSTTLEDSLQRPAAEDHSNNKAIAMSHAAYGVLVDLFPDEKSVFDATMVELELDPTNHTRDNTTPVGIGNTMADALLQERRQDGANQLGDSPNGVQGVPYSNVSAYSASNAANESTFPDRWTPEFVPIGVPPSSVDHDHVQKFLTPHWGDVIPFAIDDVENFRPDAPQPFLLVDGTVDVINKEITLTDGRVLVIDSSLIGTVINPEFINQAERVVEASASLTDEHKLIAEFWENGGNTSFPPGTWMTFGQYLSARDEHSIDDDAQLFFALANAIFDVSVATWDTKVHYDYVRPVRAIRTLGELGLIGRFDSNQGGYVIDAWTPTGQTQTILASEFLTYQTPGGDPSPPFSEYTSGHSSFSGAGATILELFSGSSEFGGSLTFETGSSRFEPGVVPRAETTLHWDTFRDAADQAGLSRIYGGIHFDEGDLRGREVGDDVAVNAWEHAQRYILGDS